MKSFNLVEVGDVAGTHGGSHGYVIAKGIGRRSFIGEAKQLDESGAMLEMFGRLGYHVEDIEHIKWVALVLNECTAVYIYDEMGGAYVPDNCANQNQAI